MKRTTEDYLKTICLLRENQGEVRNILIAEALGVSKPTVTNTLKRLVREGFVITDADFSIHLTEAGTEIAESTLERNRTIRELLVSLGVDEKTAEEDACEMEHSISAQSLAAIKMLAERQCLKTCMLAVKEE